LSVFDENEPARALYRSLGFSEADITMRKPL
jgi:ribosomal protein S18 acetylase RimI-like enzyme